MRALTLGAVLLTAATGSSASAPVVADANNRVIGFYTGPNSGNVVSTMGY